MPKLAAVLSLVALLLTSSVEAAQNCPIPDQNTFEQVGKTRLKVLFWSVYDAELWTDSGNYQQYNQRLLRLNYLRNIAAV